MMLYRKSTLAIVASWLFNILFLCEGKSVPYAAYDGWTRDIRNMSNSSMIKESFLEDLVSNLTIPELGRC